MNLDEARIADLEEKARAAKKIAPGEWNTGPETCAGHVWIYCNGPPILEPTHWLRRAFLVRRPPGEKEWVSGESSDASTERFWLAKQALAAYIAAASPEVVLALIEQRREFLMALEDMVNQHCRMEDGSLDSLALSTNADAMRLLAEYGRLEIHKEAGRRVLASRIGSSA